MKLIITIILIQFSFSFTINAQNVKSFFEKAAPPLTEINGKIKLTKSFVVMTQEQFDASIFKIHKLDSQCVSDIIKKYDTAALYKDEKNRLRFKKEISSKFQSFISNYFKPNQNKLILIKGYNPEHLTFFYKVSKPFYEMTQSEFYSTILFLEATTFFREEKEIIYNCSNVENLTDKQWETLQTLFNRYQSNDEKNIISLADFVSQAHKIKKMVFVNAYSANKKNIPAKLSSLNNKVDSIKNLIATIDKDPKGWTVSHNPDYVKEKNSRVPFYDSIIIKYQQDYLRVQELATDPTKLDSYSTGDMNAKCQVFSWIDLLNRKASLELVMLKGLQTKVKELGALNSKRVEESLKRLSQPRTCGSCGGSGKCIWCEGKGEMYYDDPELAAAGLDGFYDTCDYCNGNGKCNRCKGSGVVKK